MTIKNTVASFSPKDDFNPNHRKDKSGFSKAFLLISTNSKTVLSAEVKLYQPGINRVYCCAWIYEDGFRSSGSAWVGGYGCDKESAAVQKALKKAGFTFLKHFSGTGSTGIRGALLAIGDYISNHQKTWELLEVYP